ncbi:MAG: acyl-CoA dehydrogenase, partial [Desulfobacterales bacterium]|nr:acyl-CoA dehydrogenase [Desulfobacterales bacterium]
LVVYGQLIIEKFKMDDLDLDLLDQIFDFMVRDFSKYALVLYSKTSSTAPQKFFCKRMLRRPITATDRFKRVVEKHVFSLSDTYEMNA